MAGWNSPLECATALTVAHLFLWYGTGWAAAYMSHEHESQTTLNNGMITISDL